MNSVLQNIYDGLLNLLYEPQCPFGIEHNCSLENFCAPSGLNKVCELCLNELADLEIEPREVSPLTEVYSVAKYLYIPKQLVHRLKWTEPKLAKPIAELIAFKLNHYNLQFDYIMPVPGLVSEDRAWIPSVLLAKELSQILKIPYFDDILLKTQETKFSKLSKKERLKIVNASYQRNNFTNEKIQSFDSEPRKIVLIDDLITSGATLKTCAKAIKKGCPEHQITGFTFACVN